MRHGRVGNQATSRLGRRRRLSNLHEKRQAAPERHLPREDPPSGTGILPNCSTAVPIEVVDWTTPRAERRMGAPERRKLAKPTSPPIHAAANEPFSKAIATALASRDTFPRGDITTSPAGRSELEMVGT